MSESKRVGSFQPSRIYAMLFPLFMCTQVLSCNFSMLILILSQAFWDFIYGCASFTFSGVIFLWKRVASLIRVFNVYIKFDPP